MYDWAELCHFNLLPTILKKQGFGVAAEEPQTSRSKLILRVRRLQWHVLVRFVHKMKKGRIRPTETRIALTSLARSHLGVPTLTDVRLFRRFRTLHKNASSLFRLFGVEDTVQP